MRASVVCCPLSVVGCRSAGFRSSARGTTSIERDNRQPATNSRRPFLFTILLAISVTLSSCHIHYGTSGGEVPAGAKTLSVALFDFFFVPPRFSFQVSDGQYLVTFAVMLAVAIVTSTLAANLRAKAQEADVEARRTRALYEMARELSGALAMSSPRHLSQR